MTRAAALDLAVPADVAQLVEHFTRNEGVSGSNPLVGSPGNGSAPGRVPLFRAPGSGQTPAMGDRENRRATELWMFPFGAVLAGAGYTVGLVPLAIAGLLIIVVVATRIFAGPA